MRAELKVFEFEVVQKWHDTHLECQARYVLAGAVQSGCSQGLLGDSSEHLALGPQRETHPRALQGAVLPSQDLQEVRCIPWVFHSEIFKLCWVYSELLPRHKPKSICIHKVLHLMTSAGGWLLCSPLVSSRPWMSLVLQGILHLTAAHV